MTLTLRLAQSENALRALASGQVDAIIDADGELYLLPPAQEHFRQNQKRLHTVLESAADIITVLDRGSRIIAQTGAANRLLGYESGWLLDKPLFDFVHPEDLPQLYSAFFNVIEEFQPNALVEFRHLHRNGTYRALETMVSKLRDVSVHQVVLISRDVNRRKPQFLSAATEEVVASSFPVVHPPA